MKILITGGAGYVGTTLTPLLLDHGHKVTVFDNLMYGGAPLLPFFRNPNFEFIKGDIRDKDMLRQAVSDKDIIVHLAAIVGFPACRENPDLAKEVNVRGTQNLAEAVSKHQYVLFASTGSNYGALTELTDHVCTEESALHPLSIYGKTKTEAEIIMMHRTTCTAFRFATAFGVSPRLRLDLLINEFTYQAVKQKYLVVYESNFMRTFIHVYDMARSFLHAIENMDKMKGQIYNMGSENLNCSKKQISEIIAKETGAYVHYADVGEDADKRNYIVSYKKIRATGFNTTITLEEGIKGLVKALKIINIFNPYSNN
jgi:nucleoside-diphosphate-sugar epimerase